MRNLKFGMIGIIGILAVSCEEEDLAGTVLEAQQALAEYYLDAEEALSNVYTIVDLSMRDENLNNGDTVNVYGASVYRTSNLTSIDYGNGAIGPDGKTRKGLIKVVETGDYDTPGGRLTVSFDAYKVEDKPVTGDIDVMNNGNDSLSLSVLNFSINEKFNLNSNKTLLWKSGFDTEDASDDLFEFWGQSIGSDNVSDNLTADILNKIVLDRSCQYGVTEGVIDMVFDNDTSSTNATGTIDFIAEDGCDNLVDLSLKDGDKELDVVLQFDGF